MTTDEQQAREAAWGHWEDETQLGADTDRPFFAGWDARGEYERNRPVSDAEVEAAAKAMVLREAMEQGRDWDEAELRWVHVRDDYRQSYRLNARAALAAAREVADAR